jgi:hypothetical protein
MHKLNNLFIGGEFETKKIYKNKNLKLLTKGNYFLSGRSALAHLMFFLNEKYENIYLPYYTCQTIISVFKNSPLNVLYYDLDLKFSPLIKNEKDKSIILIIDYFGKKNNFKSKKNNLIIRDVSHSWIDYKKFPERADRKELFFCSLRKYGIFNFGGWHNYNCSTFSNDIINNRIKKINNNYLATRKKKYFFLKNENFFNRKRQIYILKKIGKLEKNLDFIKSPIRKKYLLFITKMSMPKIKKNRINNYFFLKKNINKYKLILKYSHDETPLFFLLKFKNTQQRNFVRKKLVENKIFCPIHWRIRYFKKSNFTNLCSSRMLSIPIDQRYNKLHMQYIVKILKSVNNLHDF